MYRLVYVLRRKQGMSLAEFQKYWRDVHGPLVASMSTDMGCSKYIQLHTIEEDPINHRLQESRGTMEPYDGVAELWWDGQDALAKSGSPEGLKAAEILLEDEKNFIDFDRSTMWMATDVPQINPNPENIVARTKSPIVKLFFVFRRLPELTREDAQLYWRVNHGPLIRSHAQSSRIKRYIQVHTLDDTLTIEGREARGGMEEPYDGHAELWFDRSDMENNRDIPEAQSAGQAALEDEAKFIDFSKSALWVGKEHVFIDRHIL